MGSKGFLRRKKQKKTTADIIDSEPIEHVEKSDTKQDKYMNILTKKFYEEEKPKSEISLETYAKVLEQLKQLNSDFNTTKLMFEKTISDVNLEKNKMILQNNTLKERIYLFHISMIIISVLQSFLVGFIWISLR